MPSPDGWRMPAETAPHERIWMAFPSAGYTLGDTEADAEEARDTWAAVAHAVVALRAGHHRRRPGRRGDRRRVAGRPTSRSSTAPLDDAWMRDIGPTFVVDDDGAPRRRRLGLQRLGRPGLGRLGQGRAASRRSSRALAGATPILLAAGERGRRHPRRRRRHRAGHRDRAARSGPQPRAHQGRRRGRAGPHHRCHDVIWLPRGLTRDYDEFGTRGHVDIVATIPSPGVVLLHSQDDPAHPDYEVVARAQRLLSPPTRRRGRPLEVIEVPAPTTLTTRRGSSTTATSTTSWSTAASSPAPSTTRRTRRARHPRRRLPRPPGRRRRRPAALRPRRRHPLHHPAAAARLSPPRLWAPRRAARAAPACRRRRFIG